MVRMIGSATEPRSTAPAAGTSWRGHVAEAALIVALVFLVAGTAPPDVNEAHYLTKAKHWWAPSWCGADVFLDSADAHAVFFGLFGWPTLWLSFTAVTWCGRLVTWALVAWAWQRLSWSIMPHRYVSVLTAAWFLVLTGHFQLAGEWAIGGVEAKAVAYVCVLWALRAVVRQRWDQAWVWLGAATALHVLVGGWSSVATALAWLLSGPSRPALRSMWLGLVIGAGLSLLGFLPALWLSFGVDPATAAEANVIYVFGRLPHHLVFHMFAPARLVMFGLLMIAWLLLSRLAWRCEPWACLHRFAIGALSIAVVGIMLDLVLLSLPPLAAKLLRFYWFRLSDVAVPLAVTMAIPVVLKRWQAELLPAARYLWAAAVLVPAVVLGSVVAEHEMDFRPGGIVQSSPRGSWTDEQLVARYRSWQETCQWIKQHTDPHARFLTPRNQQTFKWYAERAEVTCWKDIPQAQASIVIWWRLLQEIYPQAVIEHGLGAWSDEQLREIAQREQVDYIVVDRSHTNRRLGFPRVYPESPRDEAWFEVYQAGE
jgi:hypothetical protein